MITAADTLSGVEPVQPTVINAAGLSSITVPGADFILTAQYARIGSNLVLTSPDGDTEYVIRDYFATEMPPDLFGDTGARVAGDLAARLSGPLAPGQYAQAGPATQSQSIGRVETVTGAATATRADGTRVTLDKDSTIHAGDIIETANGASLGIVFVDKTTFAIGENARMVLDEMIFDPGSNNVSSVTSLLQGAFVIITGEIGKLSPESVIINTPAAQIGIRGTGMAFNIQQVGAESTYTLLFGAITVLNAITEILLDNPLNTVTFTSFNLPPSPVFPLSQEQFDNLFQATKTISDQLAPFSVNLGAIEPGAGGDEQAGDGPGDGGTVDPNVSQGPLSDPTGPTQPGPTDFLTLGGLDPAPGPGDPTDPDSDPDPEPAPDPDGGDPNRPPPPPAPPGPSLIVGTELGEVLTGDAGDNTIIALGGNDTLIGAGGNDILQGGTGNDDIDGGAGDDVAVYAGVIDEYEIDGGLPGEFYVDHFTDSPVNDGSDFVVNVETLIFADAAYDTITGNVTFFDPPPEPPPEPAPPPLYPPATILGTPGADTLIGTVGDDVIDALGGNDDLTGNGGADILIGGPGDDNYFYELGDGNDLIVDSAGSDTLTLGVNANESVLNVFRVADDLTVLFSDGGSVTVIDHFTLQPLEQVLIPSEEDTLNIRANGIDASDDLVVGGGGVDNLVGMGGSDVIFGGGGDDTLDGGAGNDDLLGGAGSDTLTGGGGSDFFSYTSPSELAFHATDTLRGPSEMGDTITDFQSGLGGDVIEFNSGAFDFSGSFIPVEGQDFHTITAAYDGTNSGHTGAGAHFVFSTFDSTLYYDVDETTEGYSIVATVTGASDDITANDVEIFQPGGGA